MNWRGMVQRLVTANTIVNPTEDLATLPENVLVPLQRAVAQVRRDLDKDQLCIGICGCNHSVGTSTVAVNMARQAANSVGDVLLVEANSRSPVFARHFGLEPRAGFAELLSGSTTVEEATASVDAGKLRVIAARKGSGTSAIRTFPDTLATLRKSADMVFFDLPPVIPYAETAEMSAHLDGVILVVQADLDKWEVATMASQLLEKSGARLVGAILNRKQYHIPEWLYRLL